MRSFRHAPQLALLTALTLLGPVSSAIAAPGEVLDEQKISDTVGGFLATLDNGDDFGISVAALGDLDGDGVEDIAVGAETDDDGAINKGAVYVLFLNANGTVKDEQKISDTAGGFTGTLDSNDRFGTRVAAIGDLDGDGITELAVGARRDDDGGTNRGAVWILFLDTDGTVQSHQKISDTAGGVTPALADDDNFSTPTAIGDLDGDGTTELAVGAWGDASDAGAVWILFLLPDGTVHHTQKIAGSTGGFGGTLSAGDRFGASTAGLGDLDGDDVPDLLVGADFDDDGGTQRGALWVLFLNHDGTVKGWQKISDTAGGFTGTLGDTDFMGLDVASLGDLDGDGVVDVVAGARQDDDGGGFNRGAAWVMFLNTNGTVKGHQKISDTAGSFAGVLDDADQLGHGLAAVGDLDGDGITELAAGALFDDDGGANRGATWIMNLDGSALTCGNAVLDPIEECDDGNTSDFDGCTAGCETEDQLTICGEATAAGAISVEIDGVSVFVGVSSGDSAATVATLTAAAINAEPGLIALGTTAQAQGDVVYSNGHFASASLMADGLCTVVEPGRVRTEQKISDTMGGFTGGIVEEFDFWGAAVTSLGDIDGDGVDDIAVGERQDDDGGTNRGAVWLLFLNDDGTVKTQQKISSTAGGFTGSLDDRDIFHVVESIGDLDGDGFDELAVGARGDDDGGSGRGAVWVLFMGAGGSVLGHQKISDTAGGFTGILDDDDQLGSAIAALGDLDGDGVEDIAVGALDDDDGAADRGAVWILFLNANGTVKGHQKISDTAGGFTGDLTGTILFGLAAESLGDLDGDGVVDLAVGELGNDGGLNRGAVWILFLNTNGTVKGHQKISDTAGGFTGRLDDEDFFGASISRLGDLDGDQVTELAVGAYFDDDGNLNNGATWILFMNTDGTVKGSRKISETQGGFGGSIDSNDWFGSSSATIGDLDGDGVEELVVGAYSDDDGGQNFGAVWVLFLEGVPAKCGDAEVLPPETCDDGNTTSGDGCWETCRVEDEIEFVGIAQGGMVTATVSGVVLVVPTVLGETAAMVASNLAAAIEADPILDAAGEEAISIGGRVVTTATFDSVVISDPGILLPEPGVNLMLAAGGLLLAFLRARRRA